MRSRPWLIGFATAASCRSISRPGRRSQSLRRPSETFPVSNSAVFSVTPLQSSFASRASLVRLPKEARAHLPRFLALVATPRDCVHFSAKLPTAPRTFRPQVFATSRRVSPHSRLQAYSILLPRPGLSRSGCSPLAQPPLLVGGSLPPCRCAHRTHHRSDVHASSPRLRGLHLRKSALLRASIIHLRPRSLPSSGFSPPGPFPAVHPFYSDAPLLMLPCAAFAFALAAPSHLQRLLCENVG